MIGRFIRLVLRFSGIVLVLAGLGTAGEASAQPTDPIGKWLCSTLKDGFDPVAAMKTFPLETLGSPKQKSQTDDGQVKIEVLAVGDDYELSVRYGYNVGEPKNTFVYLIEINDVTRDQAARMKNARAWLAEFGAPRKRSGGGFQVSAGEKMFGDEYPFDLQVTPEGQMTVTWFNHDDIRLASQLCAKAHAVDGAALAQAYANLEQPVTLPPDLASKMSQLRAWQCSVLVDGFDFAAAARSFPLEHLPAPVEARKTDNGNVSVDSMSKGANYSLAYHYAYASTDVSSPYGFYLRVDTQLDGDARRDFSVAWLNSFGTPKNTPLGQAVLAGPPVGNDNAFMFTVWATIDSMLAKWFFAKDIKWAGDLCHR